MFFQRRRLQVLLSVLVIVVSLLYLGGAFDGGRDDFEDGSSPVGPESQLFEAFYLLRNSYVHPLDEAPLLEGAVAAVRAEAVKRGIAMERLPDWKALPRVPGDAGLRRVQSYVDRVASLERAKFSQEAAVYVALGGMTDTLSDPYTLAMDPETYARFNSGLHSHVVGGVGLEVEWTHGAYVVFEVQPKGPAASAGVRPGDRLLSVNGVALYGHGQQTETLENVHFLLQGEVDSKVDLKLERGGSAFARSLTRASFETRSVNGRLLGDPALGQPRVGWITVESLGESTGHEMVETVEQLRGQGAVGFVIDLRDNVGGYLNAAVEVGSLFLPSGQPVVHVKGRAGETSRQTVGAAPNGMPLLVLVNGRTASSAEILAGALQDYGRAQLLGSPTFGKGSVQTVHDFADGGGFKMTTAAYLTPKKRILEGKGLTPDVPIDVTQGRDEEALHTEVLELTYELWTTTTATRP